MATLDIHRALRRLKGTSDLLRDFLSNITRRVVLFLGVVVAVAGTTMTVAAMTLVSTALKLPDHTRVVIPKNSIWGDVITNATGQQRRVDMVFGEHEGDDLQEVQGALEGIVTQHPEVHAEPVPVVEAHERADSSVNFMVRP